MSFNTRNLNMLVTDMFDTRFNSSIQKNLGDLDDACDTRLKIALEDRLNPVDVRFYGGWYNLNGVATFKAGLRNQTGAGWAGGGTFYAYITEADALILDGLSAPTSNQIPLAQIVVNAAGLITSITDMRIGSGTAAGNTGAPFVALPDGAPIIDATTGEKFITANTGATPYTNITGGYDGQELVIAVNDANTSFLPAAGGPGQLRTTGAAPVAIVAPAVIRFVYILVLDEWWQAAPEQQN